VRTFVGIALRRRQQIPFIDDKCRKPGAWMLGSRCSAVRARGGKASPEERGIVRERLSKVGTSLAASDAIKHNTGCFD